MRLPLLPPPLPLPLRKWPWWAQPLRATPAIPGCSLTSSVGAADSSSVNMAWRMASSKRERPSKTSWARADNGRLRRGDVGGVGGRRGADASCPPSPPERESWRGDRFVDGSGDLVRLLNPPPSPQQPQVAHALPGIPARPEAPRSGSPLRLHHEACCGPA